MYTFSRNVRLFTCYFRCGLLVFWVHSHHLISGCQSYVWCASSLPFPCFPSSGPDYSELPDLLWEIKQNVKKYIYIYINMLGDLLSLYGSKGHIKEVKSAAASTSTLHGLERTPLSGRVWMAVLCATLEGWVVVVHVDSFNLYDKQRKRCDKGKIHVFMSQPAWLSHIQ